MVHDVCPHDEPLLLLEGGQITTNVWPCECRVNYIIHYGRYRIRYMIKEGINDE